MGQEKRSSSPVAGADLDRVVDAEEGKVAAAEVERKVLLGVAVGSGGLDAPVDDAAEVGVAEGEKRINMGQGLMVLLICLSCKSLSGSQLLPQRDGGRQGKQRQGSESEMDSNFRGQDTYSRRCQSQTLCDLGKCLGEPT